MAIKENDLKMTILRAAWELNPTAKKIEDNPLTGDQTQWAGVFKVVPTLDNPEPIAFGFVVRRTAVKWNFMNGVDQMIFQILAFKSAITGEAGKSSEKEFQAILDALGSRLIDRDSNHPLWEFENENDDSAATVSVEFGRIALIESSEYLHFASGKHVVNIFRC